MEIKVVIAEDQLLFREGIKNALTGRDGILIIGEAENGQELLNKLQFLNPDIIILNIQMPILDGVQTLRTLKKEFPDIKVLVFSMFNDPVIIKRMIELGADSYLSKGCSSDQLYELLRVMKGC